MGKPQPAAAYFARLPAKRVLTLQMDEPKPWLVEPVMSDYDLDNLRLADAHERIVHAEYELEALMLTGSAQEATSGGERGGPPRGLQLQLGLQDQPHIVDTLVMANLGYFQLKAAPGLWQLSLAPGRSRDIYGLKSSTGILTSSGAEDAADGTSILNDVSTQVGSAEHVTLDSRLTTDTFWASFAPQFVLCPIAVNAGSSHRSFAKNLTIAGGSARFCRCDVYIAASLVLQVLLTGFSGKHMFLKVSKRAGMEEQELLASGGEQGEEPASKVRLIVIMGAAASWPAFLRVKTRG